MPAGHSLLAGGNTDAGIRSFLSAFFRPLLIIFRDWFPFFVLSACYFALYTNLIIRVNPHTADALLSRADAALLGGHQPSFLMEPMINPWLTDFFNLVYFSYVLSLPVVALYFYVKKEKKVFRRIMMGYLMLMLMGIVSYLILPAAGPMTFFADHYTRDLQGHALSHSVSYLIQSGRVAYDCFPSLHVGITLSVCFYLRDYRRKLFLPALGWVVLMCLATLYLRYHYLTDLLGVLCVRPGRVLVERFSAGSLAGGKNHRCRWPHSVLPRQPQNWPCPMSAHLRRSVARTVPRSKRRKRWIGRSPEGTSQCPQPRPASTLNFIACNAFWGVQNEVSIQLSDRSRL